MAPSLIVEEGNQPVDHHFDGIQFVISPVGNLQTIKIVYDNQQLLTSLYPDFKAAFQAHGFEVGPVPRATFFGWLGCSV